MTTATDDGEKVLSAREAAEYLGLSMDELYRLNTTIPHHKLGKYTKYLRSELNAWLQGQKP